MRSIGRILLAATGKFFHPTTLRVSAATPIPLISLVLFSVVSSWFPVPSSFVG
jgi:hypothetical protein